MNRGRHISALKITLIGLPLAVALLLLSSAWWLLKTSSGAAWIWGQVEDAAAGSIRASRVDGDLASGFSVHGFKYLSETIELSARRLAIKAGPGLWPLTIQVSSLVLQDVEIVTLSAGEDLADDTDGLQIQSALEALRLPVGVYVHSAEISNIKFGTEVSAPVKMVDSLSFSAALDEQLVVEQLVLLAPGFEANLDGQLALQAPFDVSVAARGHVVTQDSASAPGLVFPFSLESSGALENLQFTLTSAGLELGSEQLDLAVLGTLSATGVQLQRVTLAGPALELEADGTVGWSVDHPADFKLAIRHLDLSPWLEAWPAGQRLLGDLELHWSNAGLEIPRGSLALAGTSLALTLAADIDIEANAVEAQFNWRDVDWPLADTSPDFSSPSGKLAISGSFDDWQAAGELIFKLGDYPQGRLEIRGGGNRTTAHIAIPRGKVLGGGVSGEVRADWQDGLSWNLHARTSGINPEPVVQGWPGRLDAELEVNADSRSEMTRIRLASLSGTLRGVPLSGHGRFSLSGDALTLESVAFDDVELSTGEAVLQLDGTASSPAGLHLNFNGRLPSSLLQGATGNVDLTGRYSSATDHSLLDLQLQARGLAWNGFSASDLTVTTRADAQPAPIPGMQLEASGLVWRGTPLDAFSLVIEPTAEQYRLNARLAAEHVAMNTIMTLEPANQQDPFNHPWRGVLDELAVTAYQAYRFELQDPATLQWSSNSLSMSPACIGEDNGAKLCVNGDYQANGDWSLVADVAAVPLDYLRGFLDLNVHFEQYLEGRLEWRQAGGQPPAGGADFHIAAGRIIDLDNDDVLTETNEGRFGFKLVNGNLESGILDIEFPGTGFIDVDFKVLDIIENGGGNLRGRAVAQLDSLALIGQLVFPTMDDFDGQFESNIQLGGSLANPSFDGAFKLSNGLVRYAPIGLRLDQIEINGLLERSNRGSLTGKFQAGDGLGSVDGHILFEDIENIQTEVSLSGDRLLLVNTDDLKINTETDLQIGLSPQRLDVNGHIHIPDARLKPANLLVERVSDSEDLVIEGQVVATASGTGGKPPARRVYGQLEVSFGDDVLLRVPDIKTNISGSVLYLWTGDPIPLANGSYRLNGNVDVYGPSLKITNGSISFPGVPANNPLLNIRAEREIFGNTQIRSAGVQMIGTLKRPVLEAYTVPLTNEDRAWVLLVTGSDFDQGQGVGGFDVGTYIAPKLYVSYGISLFEDENVISARYDLKKGFGVKVTSGQRETGVDFSYTIDR